MLSTAFAASSAAPAGGAAIGQVILASSAAAILTVALLVLGLGHRSGRITLLGRAAAVAGRVGGLPGWAALPAGVASVSLICAAFGLYWDVSLHIDNGRDPGPLANPAHYFILLGLFGIFSAGWLAIVLPEKRPGPAALRLTPSWDVPVGGILLMSCATFALIGFPLDDIWHRLFGQDVTLWGPTHLMMLGGAAFSLLAILALLSEGRLARPRSGGPQLSAGARRIRALRTINACGGLLVGLSIFQGEFDFGVPQFRLLCQPLLIAAAASIALVVARTLAGRGAALGTVLFFLVLRGVLTLLVGPVLGESTAHFPLYVAEAAIVELVALRLDPRSGYRFGALAGALCGSAGVLAEWAWAQVWMPLPWPAHLLPQAILLAVPVGIAGGVVGSFVGAALRLRTDVVVARSGWGAALAGVVAIAAALAFVIPTTVSTGASARAVVRPISPAPHRTAGMTLRLEPATVADQDDWLTVTAWQGHDRLVVDRLRRVREGIYATTQPIPVGRSWKTLLRLQRGRTLMSVAIYLPDDPAIPARGVPALSGVDRPFVADHLILQRERKHDVPLWLWSAAGLVVLSITCVLLALLGWGLVRLASAAGGATRAPRQARAPRPLTEPAKEVIA